MYSATFTLFVTYYFQSILKARASLGISLSRGLIIGGVMLYILPLWPGQPVVCHARGGNLCDRGHGHPHGAVYTETGEELIFP